MNRYLSQFVCVPKPYPKPLFRQYIASTISSTTASLSTRTSTVRYTGTVLVPVLLVLL